MEEAQRPQQILPRIEVRPTAAQVTEQYADIALSGLFNAHAVQIASERNVIWQRYTAMLIGNSLVFAFTGGAAPSLFRPIAGSLAGIALCAIWYGMTKSGWTVFRMRVDRALEFSWPTLGERANPFRVTLEYERGRWGGWLYWLALAAIVLFGAMHTSTLVASLLS